MSRTVTTITTLTVVAAALATSLTASSHTDARPASLDDEVAIPPPEPGGPDGVVAGQTPPLTVIHVETDTGFGQLTTQGTVLFAETTAPTGSALPGGWLRVDLTVRNDGDQPIEVTALGITTDASVLDVEPLEVPRVVAPGDTELLKPHDITGSGTPPTWFTANLYAPASAPYPAQATYPVEIYANNKPTGGYRFPARAEDLPAGVFWTPGHVHAHSRSQRYAYDFKAVRWDHDLGKWVYYTEQAYVDDANGIDAGSRNEHHLIWGQPVYAMTGGWIVKCRRSQPDHLPGIANSVPGANSILVDHGNGEFAAYAHLMQHSIPANLCPAEAPVSDDDPQVDHVPVYVHEGQFLGLVGNSGPSSGPHLHAHIVDSGPDTSKSKVRGLPLNFHDVYVRGYTGFDPTVDPADWNWVSTAESAAVGEKQLIHPNSCGWEPEEIGGYTRGGITVHAPRQCDAVPDPLERPVDDPVVAHRTVDDVTFTPPPRR